MVASHPSRFSPVAAITMLRSWQAWHARDTKSRSVPCGRSRCCADALPDMANATPMMPNNHFAFIICCAPFFAEAETAHFMRLLVVLAHFRLTFVVEETFIAGDLAVPDDACLQVPDDQVDLFK